MIDIKLWMECFTELLKETFGKRIYFVSLQGSYERGEATEARKSTPVSRTTMIGVTSGLTEGSSKILSFEGIQ